MSAPVDQSPWREPAFRAYLGSTGFATLAFSMQQLLVSWLLVGVLQLPGQTVGVVQGAIGIPGIALMLWGGASADRTDPRSLLMRVYLVAPLVPLGLWIASRTIGITLVTVAVWGLAMATVLAFSSPGQAALLNRAAGGAIQRGVTVATAITFLVQMIGLGIAGQLERLGLGLVLAAQGVCLAVAALGIRRLAPSPSTAASKSERRSAWRDVVEGLGVTARHPTVRSVVSINFVSSAFNAGAFLTVFPFIVTRVYDGEAALLATLMIVFYGGATTSNLLLLRFMPLARPGRIFLTMQLVRVGILYVLWNEPGFGTLVGATVAWGLLMGMTGNLARSIVQESAPPEFRGRMLSVFTIALAGSSPIGALILGWVVERHGALNALVPAIGVSVAVFLGGIMATGLWGYRSPGGDASTTG